MSGKAAIPRRWRRMAACRLRLPGGEGCLRGGGVPARAASEPRKEAGKFLQCRLPGSVRAERVCPSPPGTGKKCAGAWFERTCRDMRVFCLSGLPEGRGIRQYVSARPRKRRDASSAKERRAFSVSHQRFDERSGQDMPIFCKKVLRKFLPFGKCPAIFPSLSGCGSVW